MGEYKLPDDLVFGLDIGTRNVVGTVGYMSASGGFKAVAIVSKEHDTRAMLDGQIHDIGKVSEKIVEVKQDLEKKISRQLTEVCIAAAGRVLKTILLHEDFEFDSETKVDAETIYSLEMSAVEKAHTQINQGNPQYNLYCVGYTTVKYYLNDYVINNLEGHKANKIGVDLIATFLPDEVVDGLYSAVENAGLSVASLTLEPIAAMNVAIPEQYRLLNIALVDVGAGTSDICLTRDGSVVAYGMIPAAGDEMTEIIAKEYLVDFAGAESIKLAVSKKKTITFKDILGVPHKINSEDVKKLLSEQVDRITKSVADKICELNGGKPASAVFVVGGGGKFPDFTTKLAGFLGIAKERVALRGEEVLTSIDFLMEDVKKDPLLVTPIGICINYYSQKNNFIFATVNGDRVKLFDNNHLTVIDALMQAGVPNEALFPRRGKEIKFKINGKDKFLRGIVGEPAVILLNGKEANMNSKIEKNDMISITESTVGEQARVTISDLDEYKSNIDFFVNKVKITCPKFAYVNNKLEGPEYIIQDGDDVNMGNYYTLGQILSFMDISADGKVLKVNNSTATLETIVYENFEVSYEDETFEDLAKDDEISSEAVTEEGENIAEGEESVKADASITVIINNRQVELSGKDSYIFVDIFNFYPFDLTKADGRNLITKVNGTPAEYNGPIFAGDVIELRWE